MLTKVQTTKVRRKMLLHCTCKNRVTWTGTPGDLFPQKQVDIASVTKKCNTLDDLNMWMVLCAQVIAEQGLRSTQNSIDSTSCYLLQNAEMNWKHFLTRRKRSAWDTDNSPTKRPCCCKSQVSYCSRVWVLIMFTIQPTNKFPLICTEMTKIS